MRVQQAGAAPGAPAHGAPGKLAGGGVPGGGPPIAAPPDRFGLLGLLGVIRMTDPDLTTLALGTDLTTLGLNLNSPENVFKTFASPWADTPLRPEPDFKARARGCTPGQRLRSEAGACVSVWHPFRRLSAQRSLAQNLKLPVRSYPIMGR